MGLPFYSTILPPPIPPIMTKHHFNFIPFSFLLLSFLLFIQPNHAFLQGKKQKNKIPLTDFELSQTQSYKNFLKKHKRNENNTSICPNQLPDLIDSIWSSPKFSRSYWGIQVESYNTTTGDYSFLYGHNNESFMLPASNNKVLTTAAAFHNFGPNYQVSTPYYMDKSTSVPTICVAGQGDPAMTYEQLQYAVGNVTSSLQDKTNGIDLIMDDSFFQGVMSQWDWGDLQYNYGTTPGSFIVDENAVTVTANPGDKVGDPIKITSTSEIFNEYQIIVNDGKTGDLNSTNTLDLQYLLGNSSVLYVSGNLPLNSSSISASLAILDPTTFFTNALKFNFQKNNVTINSISSSSCNDSSHSYSLIYETISPPITTTMNWTLQYSDNLYAETFLRRTGADSFGVGSDQSGIAATQAILNDLGVNATSYVQDDGCGLSRQNLVSTQAIMDTLKAVNEFNKTFSDIYISFLPVAGESGSLIDRYVGTPAQGILHAKTGTLNGVCALSGFVYAPGFETVLFSILVNLSQLSSTDVREGIDEIGVYLAELQYC